MTLELDPATQKVVDDFDASAQRRAAELPSPAESATLQALRVNAFCLGYKAGVIDLGASLRERPDSVVAELAKQEAVISQLRTVLDAAIAWRDSPGVDARALAGVGDRYEVSLVAAIDAARKALR